MWQRRGSLVTAEFSNVSFICHYQPFLPHSKWETEALLMQFGIWREIWGMERSKWQSFHFPPGPKLHKFTTGSQDHRSSLANCEPQHKRLEIWVLWQGDLLNEKSSMRLKINLKKISTEDNSVTLNLVKADNTGHKQKEKSFPRAEHKHGMSGLMLGKRENTQTVGNRMEHTSQVPGTSVESIKKAGESQGHHPGKHPQ